MECNIKKMTDKSLMDAACQFTLHSHNEVTVDIHKIYKSEHSPMRTQMYWIELIGVRAFVSVHLTRHKIGVEHFVQTMRDDRGANEVADRNTLVNHAMFINAQALVNIARKRLCKQAHIGVQECMRAICVELCEDELYEYLVPDCVYRNGCYEIKTCGLV